MRDFVHVDDVAAANVAAIEADRRRASRRSTCARAGRSRSSRWPNELCEARGDVPPLVTGQYRSGDVRHIVASPAGAAELLGFRAVIDPRDGLARVRIRTLAGLTSALKNVALDGWFTAILRVSVCSSGGLAVPATTASA